jgi:tetrathionate reductase subunit B
VFGDINDPESEAAMVLKENKDRLTRVVNAESDTKPNMYYLGRVKLPDWPQVARIPGPMETLTNVASPGFKVLAGLTGLGLVGAALKQYLLPEDEEQGAED